MSDEEVDVFASAETTVVDEDKVKRDRWGRYMLPVLPQKKTAKGAFAAPAKGEVPWTRATTFAKAIADTFALNAWMQRMAIKGVTMREDLYALTAATPIENRKELDEIVEEAKKAAGAKVAASLGTALHSFTESLDRGEEIQVPKAWKRDTTAYSALLKEYGLRIPAKAIERIVVVNKFRVAGTFDRIAQLTRDIEFSVDEHHTVTIPKDTWVILDLKTGRDLSYGWNEISIQLYLYAVADAIWNPDSWRYEAMPQVSQDWALVVHLPVGKARAELIALDLSGVATGAQLCYDAREWRRHRTITHSIGVAESPLVMAELKKPESRPVEETEALLEASAAAAAKVRSEVAPGLDEALAAAKAAASAAAIAALEEVEAQPPTRVRPASWTDKVKAATTKEELSDLWKAGQAAGEWTDALTALGKEQIAKMQPSQK